MKRPQIYKWKYLAGALAGLIVALTILIWLWGLRSDHSHQTPPPPSSSLAEQVKRWLGSRHEAPYRLTRTFTLGGAMVVTVDHRQRRQGFVVISGVEPALANRAFDDALNESDLETLANGLLTLKNPLNPDPLTIDALITRDATHDVPTIHDARAVRRIEARFHTTREPKPREIQALAARLNATHGGETLIATYCSSSVNDPSAVRFTPELLATFLRDVSSAASARPLQTAP